MSGGDVVIDDGIDPPGPVEPDEAGDDVALDEHPEPPAVLREDDGEIGAAGPWVRVDWWVCLGLLALSLLLTGMHTSAYRTLSPIDELQHVDYVLRAGQLDIPRQNERVGFEAMAEAACRSVDSPGYEGPACGLSAYDPNDFQERGINTSATQFPPYYVLTGVTARALTEVGLFDSKVTAARMLGAVWLAAAWSVTWYVMALLDIRRRHRALLIGLLTFSPLVLFHGAATVNADVSLMLAGALAVLATVKYESGALRWWWLVPIYAGLFFVEATNILAITACAAYLALRRGLDSSLAWRQRLAPLLVFPGLYLLRVQVAGRAREALFPAADPTVTGGAEGEAPMFANHRVVGVDIERVIGQLPSTFTPVRNPYFSPPLRSQLTVAGVQLTDWLLIGLLFVGAFVGVVRASATSIWARVVIAALLAAGPFYTFYFAYFNHSDFPAPARFALPLVPLMTIVAAAAIRSRATEITVAVVAGLVAANTLFQLVTAL